jgi:hypothetical protein
MIEAADFQSHNGQLVAIQPQHALIVLQEPPNDVRLDVRAVVDRDEFVYLGRKLEQPPRHSTGDIF